MLTTRLSLIPLFALCTVSLAAPLAAAPPATMRKVTTKFPFACKAPFSCVQIATVPVPTPKSGEALIKVGGSSVNPSDVDIVEAGGCIRGCGNDVAGTVVACPGCTRLKPGDKVWTMASGAYSDYIVSPEKSTGLQPDSLDALAAGTIPEVGLTSLFCLKRTGAPPGTAMPRGSPWQKGNLTVVITSGSGGTGFMGIEIAKAYGASQIATATTGAAGVAFVKSLGATFVTDYKKQDIFDALPENSVDVVYDNYGAEGTADKAMKVLRSGGVYLMLPHGECYISKSQKPPCLSAHPKEGVTQYNYATASDYSAHSLAGLDELRDLFNAGKLSAKIDRTFALPDAAKAFNYSAGGGQGGVSTHRGYGKISIGM